MLRLDEIEAQASLSDSTLSFVYLEVLESFKRRPADYVN